jgi:hypothetical protein
MEREDKLIIAGIATLITIILSFVLLFNDVMNYFIVGASLAGVLFIYLIILAFSKTDDISVYNKELRKILKTYDSIIVYTKDEIILTDQNVIFLKKFKDLLKSQEEFNKPILYYEEPQSSVFTVQDGNELLVYIMKINENVDSRNENRFIAYVNNSKKQKETDVKVLDDLDKTTIIQLKNNKTVKVSPVRKNK